MFAEVKRHKPSVIYLPGVDTWYHTLSEAVITTFLGLLRAIPPTDPVLVLGITDAPIDRVSPDLLRDLFGFSKKNRFTIERPSRASQPESIVMNLANPFQENRSQFFSTVVEYVKKAPKDFPEPMNRKKRKLDVLEIVPPPPPKPPTKEEIKALKKRDHQFLNHLKTVIQPIMDQINKKYKKFRAQAIPQSQIQYLFDELDPNYVRPDLPQAAQFRPFEVDADKDGVPGLRETASGKFYYNLETTTIEERLSNGFYARPKDFVADIRTLARDSRHLNDKDRILKANEMLANVEVDLALIEANPAFADAENVYQRQLQRTKEREEKLKKQRADQTVFDSVVTSDLPEGALNSEEPASGPLTLGEPFPGRLPASLASPFRATSGLSNGYSADNEHAHGRNGTSVPSRSGDDVQMGGTDESESQAMQPPQQPSVASGPSILSNLGTRPNTEMSQRSAFQEISHDTSPKDLINDASTTTSGKKTSEGWSTQATNGISTQHSSSPVERPGQDSELPDTQRNTQTDTSSEEWAHSQAHGLARGNLRQSYPSQTPSSGSQPSQPPAVPSFSAPPKMPAPTSRPSGFANLLNDSPVEPTSSQVSSQKELVLDDYFLQALYTRLVEGTSGCSVEQLEQINRELMETLWTMRGEYNRDLVAQKLSKVFTETIIDMEEMQKVLQASQP